MNPVAPAQQAITELSIIPVALIVGVGVFLGFSVLVGILVIVIVANRAEPDNSGRRPLAVYFFGMSFIAVFLTLFGSYAIVLALVQLIGSHYLTGFGPTSIHPVGDAVARVVVVSGLIVVVGIVLLITHIRRGLALPEWNFGSYGPVGRVAQSYAAAVCFISVLIAALAFVALGYELFRLVAPGVFEVSGPRVDVARTVISLVYLVVAAIVVALVHSRIPPNGFWGALWSPHSGPGTPTPGGAAGGHAPSHHVELLHQTQHLQPTHQPRTETAGVPSPPQVQQHPQTPRPPPPPPPPRQPQPDPPQAPPSPST